MSVQKIKTYNYKNTFSLSNLQFEKACVFNKPHQFDTYSIYWIKKGSGEYQIDFKRYTFSDNELFFLSPGQLFSVKSEKINDAYKLSFKRDFYCIQTHDHEISCNGILFNNIYETPHVKPTKEHTKRLQDIVNNLIEEFELREAAQYDMLQAYLKQFIIQSVRVKKNFSDLKPDQDSLVFKNFSTLVEQNFKINHKVSHYANRLGLSPKSLSKHFNRLGSQSPSDFIKNRIILEAKRLLLFTDDSVKQIAYNIGFNDPAYFTRFFKKTTQKSPLQFKKEEKF